MKQLEFTTLRLFVAVAEQGSLSAVADRSGIAVAAISKRISDLELASGTTFFVRHVRGMSLTPAGRALLQHAREILYGVDRMQSDLRHFALGIKGHVRIAAMNSAVVQFLPSELKAFCDLHPNVSIELSEWTSQAIVEALLEGRVDVGIFVGAIPAAEITTHPYHQDRLCLVTPADHPLAARRSLRFEETLGHDYIGLSPRSSIAQRMMAESGGRLRLRMNVLGSDAMCRMIAAGLGIGIAPLLMVEHLAASMPIAIVELDEAWAQRQLLIGLRGSGQDLAGAARSFVDHCRQAALQRAALLLPSMCAPGGDR